MRYCATLPRVFIGHAYTMYCLLEDNQTGLAQEFNGAGTRGGKI